jgi:hypothetical protein
MTKIVYTCITLDGRKLEYLFQKERSKKAAAILCVKKTKSVNQKTQTAHFSAENICVD